MKNFRNERGLSILGMIFLGVIFIFVLSYFQVSIQSVAEDPQTKSNFNYVSKAILNVWENYLKAPASYLWNDVWVGIFWQSFINNMERLRDGEPTVLDTAAQGLEVEY